MEEGWAQVSIYGTSIFMEVMQEARDLCLWRFDLISGELIWKVRKKKKKKM